MFKTGLAGQMFDDAPCRDHLEAAAENGYDGIQIRAGHLNTDTPDEEVDGILAFIKENRIAVNGLSCFTGNYGILDDAECESAFEDFAGFARLAVRMDAGMVRVWPGWHESASAPPAVWERAAAWMKKSADFAGGLGVRIGIETHHGTLCDSADSSARLLEMIGKENVGLLFDPVNLYQTPSDYGPAAITKLAGRIFDVHVKDIIGLSGDYFPYSFEYSYYATHIGRFAKVVPPRGGGRRYFCHRRINHGGIDWSAVLTGLEETGYEGYLTVESVCEGNKLMPAGKELAKVCGEDLRELVEAMESAQ